jgi:hypothetical protein
MLADICASIVFSHPVEASGEFLDRLYNAESKEYADVNSLLTSYG